MCNRYKYADDVYHRVCNKVFSGVRVTRSLVLCFVNRCLSILFWSLYCLVIFDIQILITSLVSSSSSYGDPVVYVVKLYVCRF